MSSRFLIDEDSPVSLAAALRALGHDAIHSRDAGLLGKGDAEVFDFARREERILITRDLGFGDTRLYPIGGHSGIVVLRVPAQYVAGQITELVIRFIAEVSLSEIGGALAIVRPDGYRIRRKETI